MKAKSNFLMGWGDPGREDQKKNQVFCRLGRSGYANQGCLEVEEIRVKKIRISGGWEIRVRKIRISGGWEDPDNENQDF